MLPSGAICQMSKWSLTRTHLPSFVHAASPYAAGLPGTSCSSFQNRTPRFDVRFTVLRSGTEMVFQSWPSKSSAYLPSGDQPIFPTCFFAISLREPSDVLTRYESL